jgi:hypothetical protein
VRKFTPKKPARIIQMKVLFWKAFGKISEEHPNLPGLAKFCDWVDFFGLNFDSQ